MLRGLVVFETFTGLPPVKGDPYCLGPTHVYEGTMQIGCGR